MAAGDAHWKTGVMTVPASTGVVAYTGLGGTPKALFFFGTNWLTEDASETSSGLGMFRGMASPKWDDPGTIVQNGAFVGPPGDQHVMDNSPIRALTSAGTATNLYAAGVDSFDADGFSLNWVLAAAGGYKVIYVALMDVTEVGGYIGEADTLAFGWKAGAAMLHGAWAGPVVFAGDRSQEFYGSAAYPGTSSLDWMSAGLTAYTFPSAAGSGQRNLFLTDGDPTTAVAQGGRFIGPFLTASNVLMYPSGGTLTDFTYDPQSIDNAGMVVAWSDEANATGSLTPAASAAGTATVSGLTFEPGLVIGYSISDEPTGQVSGAPPRGAVGFSAVTRDFQWAALADGAASGIGSFQSLQRGFVDTVSGSDVHAGTIELTADGFILTTVEDSASPSPWVWHAFGHPSPTMMWTPNLYRRQLP